MGGEVVVEEKLTSTSRRMLTIPPEAMIVDIEDA